MTKEVRKSLLMTPEFIGNSVMVETNLGGIRKRYFGTLTSQAWVDDSDAEEIILTVPGMSFTIGLRAIEKAYINIETSPKCPSCNKTKILTTWVEVDVPQYLTHEELCPNCREGK